jgi:hypothetical protein
MQSTLGKFAKASGFKQRSGATSHVTRRPRQNNTEVNDSLGQPLTAENAALTNSFLAF